jgi:NADPH-dependent curcumin reductase
MRNTQIRLAARPVGNPQPNDFQIVTEEFDPLSIAADSGEVWVENHYISLDPAMRGWMNASKSYIRPVEIDEVMRAGGAGQVIASSHPDFAIGDFVVGTFGVQQYYYSKNGKGLTKVSTQLAPLSNYLGVLGMPGMTAYFGILDVGAIKEGDTVLVSGAAGAVGSIVGQIAKIKGCRVIGTAGGQDKVDYLVNELGFDVAIDYKKGKLRSELRAACPDGIDVYFDNVGGEQLDLALSMLRFKARIAICGAISQYNATEGVAGPKNYLSLLVNRAKMEGFVVFDYAARYGEAIKDMAGWMKAGKLKSREHIVDGKVEDFLDTLMVLFEGDKIGKLLLKIK